MLEWLGRLGETLLAWGYPGVYTALVIEGLGLPFPGDMLMAFYGFAAARGDLSAPLVILASVAGYLTSSVTVYLMSRRYGAGLTDRIGRRLLLNHRLMPSTARLIERYGPWLLVPGRFLPGIRSVSSYVAGASRMDFQPFLVYTVIGSTLWCSAWIGIGYWFGENLDVVVDVVRSGLTYTTAVGLLVLYAVWLYRRKTR